MTKKPAPSFAWMFLQVFLPVSAVVLAVSLSIAHLQAEAFGERLVLKERALLSRESELLEKQLEIPLRDAVFLTRLFEQHLMDGQGDDHACGLLSKEIVFLGESRQAYDQLRLLCADGRERVRVDLKGARAEPTPRGGLQDKSDRPYYRRGMAAASGLYISRFDLNVERGVIEQPIKPMLRFTSLVRNPDGSPWGLVVLNFRGGEMLNQLLRAADDSEGDVLLLNAEGDWLLGPTRAHDFSFQFPDGAKGGFASGYPQEWATVHASGSGQFRTNNGLFTYRTLHFPLQKQNDRLLIPETDERLALVSLIPPERFVPAWRPLAVWGLAGITALVAAMSFFLARARANQAKAVAALQGAEERWNFALEAARDGVWDWNVETGEASYTKRWKEMLGYGEDEIADAFEEWETRVHPRDKDKVLAVLNEHLDGTTPFYEVVNRLRGKDGSYRWIHVRGKAVVRDAQGRPLRVVGTHTDVTDRMEAERELEKSRANLAQAQILAGLGSWDYDPATGALICSGEMCRIFGVEAGKALERETFFALIHPEDRERLRDVLREVRERGGSYVDRHRLLRPDGEIRWIEGRGEAVRDETGGTTRISGTVQDITAQVRARQAIEDREGMLRAISEASLDAIVVIGEDDAIVQWNPAAERLFGYSFKEAEGRSLHALIARTEDAERSRSGLAHFASCGTGPAVDAVQEMTAVRKSGEEFSVELSVASFLRGDKWYAVGTMRDITERKRQEQRLRELATTDGLTGLNNRRHFMELADRAMRQALRFESPLAAVMFDVDHFKRVNDAHGHDAGDEVLRTLSALALKTFRDIDVVGRLGGEEFGVILPRAGLEDARQAAERLRAAVEAAVVPTSAGDLGVRISAGVAVMGPGAEDVESLLKRADTALYAAKNGGRNRVEVFAES